MSFNQQSPFGTGDESSLFGTPDSDEQHVTDSRQKEFTGVGDHDYRFGGYQSTGGQQSERIEVPVWRAPWALLGSAGLAAIASVYLVYYVADRWLLGQDVATPEVVLLAVGVLPSVIGAVLLLRSYRAGRILLTFWAVLCLLLLLHSTLWPVSLLAAGGAVLAWLPAGRRWTDY